VPGRTDRLTRFLIAASLALLLAHAFHYAFLTDDAYISFRYARNLAQGHGLVFNSGGERVEGYTNFLWVAVLAVFHALGAAPERAAPFLTLACTVALWGVIVRFCLRRRVPHAPPWVAALPLLWLASTRSFAVWSSGGLETRLFELLVFGGVVRLLDESEAPPGQRRSVAWLLFALAALARPDGILIAAAVLGAAVLHRWLSGAPEAARRLLFQGAMAAAVIGAHFLFRRFYYGEWLPNTYYAKAAGVAWAEMGARYLLCFALEYAAWLWAPLLLLAVLHPRGRPSAPMSWLFAAAVLPHALYVVFIGGDHFEYRPLDLYLPFLFILMARGLGAWAAGGRRSPAAAGAAAVVALGLVWLPLRTHLEYPDRFEPGFPGLQVRSARADRFMDPRRDPLYRWPGLRWVGSAYQSLLRQTTRHLVGFRQEGHRLFLESLESEAAVLRRLMADEKLPPGTQVALSSVGYLPYATDLTTLDRLGLTDRGVARLPTPPGPHFLGHGKVASVEYAAARGVDLWAEDQAHLVLPAGDRRLIRALWKARASDSPVYAADAGEGHFLLARLPLGPEQAATRLPRLGLEPVADDAVLEKITRGAIAALSKEREPGPEAASALAAWLALDGRKAEALQVQDDLAQRHPENADILLDLHALLLQNREAARAKALEGRILSLVRRESSRPFVQAVERHFAAKSLDIHR